MCMIRNALISILCVSSIFLTSRAEAATAEIVDANGNSFGIVTLTQAPGGVLVKAELRSLTPGGHGFHVHEKGLCSPNFKAAGGHFNPGNSGHGLNHSGGSHAGDMPNIYAAADGSVVAEVFNPRISLSKGPSNVFDNDGSAIIVHAKPDTHGKKAGAGDRVACGVIKK